MKRILILGIVLAVVPAMNALADRCVAPKDTSVAVTDYSIPAFAQSDIVFCDDFDSYCSPNYLATSYWPGYPPSPDNVCTTSSDTVYSEWWMKSANTVDHHNWDKTSATVPPNFGVSSSVYNNTTHSGWEGWDMTTNWVTLPYFAFQAGNQSPVGRASYDFDLAQGIAHKFPTYAAVNGTDANPLTLRYYLNDNVSLSQTGQPAWGKPPTFQFFVDLNQGTDRAAVDYVMSGDTTLAGCKDTNGTVVYNFPIICQQNTMGQGILPAICPDTSLYTRPIHHSIAFGWVAALDLNPCDVDSGRNPTMYHAATFDGQKWMRLISNQNGAVGDFNWDAQQAFFEVTIKTATYDLRMIAPLDCTKAGCANPPGYSIVTNTISSLERKYTGPFDRISMGAGLGCELDSANGWGCKSGSVRNAAIWNWNKNDNAYVDRVVVLNGEPSVLTGACCVQTGENAGTCTNDMLEADCTGVWHGAGTTCETSVACCPMPFADADHDGDVDQDDFGAFQVCYTGTISGRSGRVQVLQPGRGYGHRRDRLGRVPQLLDGSERDLDGRSDRGPPGLRALIL